MANANGSELSVQGTRLQQAYAKHADAIGALGREALPPINVDVPAVYMAATGTLSRLGAHRAAVLALPGIDAQQVKHVDEYLLALGHAQALYLAASQPVAAIPEQYAQLVAVRALLLSDTTALVKRGLVPGDRLAELRGPVSHAAVAFDVLALTSLLRSRWDSLAGKTALTEAELRDAEGRADALLTAVGERKAAAGEAAAEAVRARQAAFALFARAYDELRRGVVFLRWHHDDADEIAPSLYAGRSARRKKDDARESGEAAPDSEPTAPATDSESPLAD